MNSRQDGAVYLVGDVGGTNTRLALSDAGEVRRDSIVRFRNADVSDPMDMLRTYLEQAGNPPVSGCCLAVAGPVRDGVAKMSNLDWEFTADALAQASGVDTVAVLNDLQALGHGLDHAGADDIHRIDGFPAAPDRPLSRLVVGLGTGFNAAAVHLDAQGAPLVCASECGYITLPCRAPDDLALARQVSRKDGFAAAEDVLSGSGLEATYAWVAQKSGTDEGRSAAEICRALGDNPDGVTAETAALFIRILGAVVGDLALVHLPYGGIFLAGGVARAISPFLQQYGFGAAFRDKGRKSALMQAFPLALITDDYAALNGCAGYLTLVGGVGGAR